MSDTVKKPRKSRLESAREQLEQARARLQAIEAKARTVDRKTETRRKIIIGGLLIEEAKRNRDAQIILARLLTLATRDQDKRVFEDWSIEGEPENEASPQGGAVRAGAEPRI